ncbi:phytanoyl-CoA dioxygenase family protein [Algoriphagus yeomjeoni]|uniref:phytanoyl-CoA dioxygenase family protein n=1 Tax=Algoriphagus yeomjeoni TaxID=291403 RepID=UPI003CE5AAFC
MLSQDQINQFEKQGFLHLASWLEGEKLEQVIQAIEKIEQMDGPEFFREKTSKKIRTVFAPEKFDSSILDLIKNSPLPQEIKQLLKSDFYLFQSKLNTKACLESGVWSWHQDFKFWREDGMLEPKALTVAIMLTDVDVANGPILAIPSSQQEGEVNSYLNNPDGVHDENLKYMISQSTLASMVDKYSPIIPFTGKAGDVHIFHCNLLHSSYQNMGVVDRKLLMFTFNPIENIQEVSDPRPEYMVKRDTSAINPN